MKMTKVQKRKIAGAAILLSPFVFLFLIALYQAVVFVGLFLTIVSIVVLVLLLVLGFAGLNLLDGNHPFLMDDPHDDE
jgi:hypothetical protein